METKALLHSAIKEYQHNVTYRCVLGDLELLACTRDGVSEGLIRQGAVAVWGIRFRCHRAWDAFVNLLFWSACLHTVHKFGVLASFTPAQYVAQVTVEDRLFSRAQQQQLQWSGFMPSLFVPQPVTLIPHTFDGGLALPLDRASASGGTACFDTETEVTFSPHMINTSEGSARDILSWRRERFPNHPATPLSRRDSGLLESRTRRLRELIEEVSQARETVREVREQATLLAAANEALTQRLRVQKEALAVVAPVCRRGASPGADAADDA